MLKWDGICDMSLGSWGLVQLGLGSGMGGISAFKHEGSGENWQARGHLVSQDSGLKSLV